jgi:hypothetical protein
MSYPGKHTPSLRRNIVRVYTDCHRIDGLSINAPVVSSTSSIGGFSPELRGSGLFLGGSGRHTMRSSDTAWSRRAMRHPSSPRIQESPMAGATPARRTSRAPQKATPSRSPAPSRIDYLRRILTAKVYDVAIESPLDAARTLSRRLGNQVLLKREDLQPVFSFKLRGAYNKMAHLTPEQLKRGVICASAGNHAQGVALSAKRWAAARSS